MKPNQKNYSIYFTMPFLGMLCFMQSDLQAGSMGPVEECCPGKVYLGVFGGGGSSNSVHLSQYGTAFYPEELGGPLAVNSFGYTHRRNVGLAGGQIGYQWPNVRLSLFNPGWELSPAVELEGYYLGKGEFEAHINNATARLAEHNFIVNYPMETGVFLGNAIINFNPCNFARWHPFVGAGIGGAVISINHATSTQVTPLEPGVNHYNSHPLDSISVFAGQVKAGLKFDINSCLRVLAEYRGLFVADSNYTFGSTVFPGHFETNSWLVKMNSQYYNLGSVGLQFLF